MILYCVFLSGSTYLTAQEKSCEEVFSEVYDNLIWGVAEDGDPSSGWGSHYKYAQPYIEFLQRFLEENSIKKVLDLGCGAWEICRHLDWTGIEYIGIDVCPKMIALNQHKFGSSEIQFLVGDILTVELPDADLVICKDVLQHLKNKDVELFLSRTKKYKHSLLTNDIATSKKNDVRIHKKNRQNPRRGATRPLDLTLPPFNVEGTKVLTYPAGEGDAVKQVLYIHLN